MKRLISFFLLLCVCVAMFAFPTVAEAEKPLNHGIPMWSVLCYLVTFCVVAIVTWALIRKQQGAEE